MKLRQQAFCKYRNTFIAIYRGYEAWGGGARFDFGTNYSLGGLANGGRK